MKTIVLNTFSSFATFPMFNPAYIKGLNIGKVLIIFTLM